MQARSAITINASREAIYGAWRDLERLPSFMDHLDAVTEDDERRSHWVAKAPAGTTVEWDAEITEELPGEKLSWRSLGDASIEGAGSVQLRPAPGGRGTEVHVVLEYTPPGGALGAIVAKLLGEEPNQQISDDLRRFKQLIETGEIARSEGSPLGSRTEDAIDLREAQPSGEADRPDREIRA